MIWRFVRPSLALVVLVVIFVSQVAASAGDSASIANALAGAAVIISPLVLKYVKLDGPTMLTLSFLLSVAIAAAALFLSGEAKPDFSSSASVLAFAIALFGLQQIVFQALKDNSTLGPLVK